MTKGYYYDDPKDKRPAIWLEVKGIDFKRVCDSVGLRQYFMTVAMRFDMTWDEVFDIAFMLHEDWLKSESRDYFIVVAWIFFRDFGWFFEPEGRCECGMVARISHVGAPAFQCLDERCPHFVPEVVVSAPPTWFTYFTDPPKPPVQAKGLPFVSQHTYFMYMTTLKRVFRERIYKPKFPIREWKD